MRGPAPAYLVVSAICVATGVLAVSQGDWGMVAVLFVLGAANAYWFAREVDSPS